MPIPFKLDHIVERLAAVSVNERAELRRLAGVKLSTFEARDRWPRMLEHKRYLSERLGRDVGMRVAAVDYFENIEPLRLPASSGREGEPLLPRLPMMLRLGERP